MSQKKTSYKTLQLVPKSEDRASKPAELIHITGHENLTLNARRAITILWHNAHKQGIEPGKDYTIETHELVAGRHKGSETVEEAVIQLMQTIIVVQHKDGSVRRVQFLGGNDMDDPSRPHGAFTYSFDKRLIEILKDSSIWGRIDLNVLMALSSKYGVSLYEAVSQWSGLFKHKQYIVLDQFRELLGIEKSKYKSFGELNKHVIKPCVSEINALASFNVAIQPIKTGRKVSHIMLSWWPKNQDELKQAYAELQRPKTGRKARIHDTVETTVFPPSSTPHSMARKAKKIEPFNGD